MVSTFTNVKSSKIDVQYNGCFSLTRVVEKLLEEGFDPLFLCQRRSRKAIINSICQHLEFQKPRFLNSSEHPVQILTYKGFQIGCKQRHKNAPIFYSQQAYEKIRLFLLNPLD